MRASPHHVSLFLCVNKISKKKKKKQKTENNIQKYINKSQTTTVLVVLQNVIKWLFVFKMFAIYVSVYACKV